MRKINAVLLVLALGLLAYFVNKVGLAPIVAGFTRVGWGFLALLGVFVSCFLLETWNWSRCFRAPPPYASFLLPSWCGQSINQLTPGSSLGEVVKGGLLAQVAPSEAVVSSLILYNIAYAYGTALVVLCGSASLWLLAFAPLWLRLAGTLFALLLLSALTLFHRSLLQGRASRWLCRLATWRDYPWLHRAARHLARWETEMRLGATERPLRFRHVVLVNFVTQAFPIFELWLTWLLLGVRLDIVRCFIFVGIDTLANIMFMIVPGKLGVAEGTTYLTSGLLRLSPSTGLTKQLIGRAVRLVFSAGGALALGWITLRRPRPAEERGAS